MAAALRQQKVLGRVAAGTVFLRFAVGIERIWLSSLDVDSLTGAGIGQSWGQKGNSLAFTGHLRAAACLQNCGVVRL